MNEIIVSAIKREIEENNLSVVAMAKELNLRQQTLDRILKGKRGIGRKSLVNIMSARPQWWGLINGSAPADDDDGRGPGRSSDLATHQP